MYKAYVIGEKSLIQGFKSAGFEVFHALTPNDLQRAFQQIQQDGGAEIILITEELAQESKELIQDYRLISNAVITTIPTHKGSIHLGFKELKRQIEYSIGVDMLGKEEQS
ncbi:MAG TPA: V-type ATP synthase subunit F [Candidatus Hydrogenedens sp.]|nr:hypothetical protein [Candidatus Hydrogenedens sp.]HOK09704.1 V-type ATP synthase subunit F [Candidatus Hydrogenedens sp.]HOL19293.1 V-type ATP synthase subunit F [Candidatus Hydrogenedens sp.]HPP59246.1 V-type ATP synthase subunit F [Candidatus Hydrogenedens sp.]